MRAIYTLSLFTLCFSFLQAQSIYFVPKIEVKAGTTVENPRLILDGHAEITLKSGPFDLNLAANFGNNVYIIDLSEGNNNSDYVGEAYFNYQTGNYGEFGLGYVNSVASESSIEKLLYKKKQYIGIDLLSYKAKDSFVLSNSYLNNNTALSFYYLIGLLDNRLYLGTTYTPDINRSIRAGKSADIVNTEQVIDFLALYYDEIYGFGYGLQLSFRDYFFTKQFIADNSKYKDYQIGLRLDWLGVSFISSYLMGRNMLNLQPNIKQDTNFVHESSLYNTKYSAYENSLSYTFFNFSTGIYYLLSRISSPTTSYVNSLIEMNFNYDYSYNINLQSSIFTNQIEDIFFISNRNYGVLFAVTFTL